MTKRTGQVELKKGDGCLSYYENNEGRRVYVTEVVAENVQFLGSGQGAGAMERREASSRNENPFAEDQRPIDISDDDLPF
ncbi:single stranded DNA-binding domain-containing protein [Aneurinibacillus aneurinilyticus]|uniref:hypothetical protein n=1 Tax=Aneurinibacillus aneurinilyticus TaxID=1391 RepID=UPI00366DC0DA